MHRNCYQIVMGQCVLFKTPYAGAYDEFAEERSIIGVVTKKRM